MKVALIPSNQNHNVCVDGSNEMVQVAAFIEVLLAQTPTYITSKVFVPQPESLDTIKFEALYAIQKQVNEWQPDLAINLHTDSGYYTHSGCYRDGSEVIQKLCEVVSPKLQKIFGGSSLGGNYSDYIFAMYDWPAILFELGSHQVRQDIATLKLRAVDISKAIWEGVTLIFGNVDQIPEHLDHLWAGANQMKTSAIRLRETSAQLIKEANDLETQATATYERIIAIKKALGLE